MKVHVTIGAAGKTFRPELHHENSQPQPSTTSTLSCAGYAAEILYPATLMRFEQFAPTAQPALTSLVLSAWLYPSAKRVPR